MTAAARGAATVRSVASSFPAGPGIQSFRDSPIDPHYWQLHRSCQIEFPMQNVPRPLNACVFSQRSLSWTQRIPGRALVPVWCVKVLRRVCGSLWLAAWGLVLVWLLDLWSALGGLVTERQHWWARLGLTAGPVIGCMAGQRARQMACWGSGWSHAALLRWFWLPPAALVCLTMLVLAQGHDHDAARAVFGTWCGYWAGFDAAIAAWPLVCGRPYRFARDIPPEELPESPPDVPAASWWA